MATDSGDFIVHPAELSADKLLAECDVQRVRRSGPGGQHRNKVETGIVLTHRPSGVRVEATERRSQQENLQQAVKQMRLALAFAVRSQRPADECPSALWRQRCRQGRISVSLQHVDFPSILAELLDVLSAHEWEVPDAAARLGCSASQLLKLLRAQPGGLAWLNRQREERGLRRLK